MILHISLKTLIISIICLGLIGFGSWYGRDSGYLSFAPLIGFLISLLGVVLGVGVLIGKFLF